MAPDRTNHHCPRCLAVRRAAGEAGGPPLFAGSAAGMTLHGCAVCGGVFLGIACARRLAEAQPAEALHLASQAAAAARYQPDLTTPLACPVCQKVMQRTHALSAGVEIDSCALHGTWYDRGELERIAQAIRGSGWGSALAPAAVAGGVAAAPHMASGHASSVAGSVAGTGAEIATDVGSALVIEGVFALVGALFE